MNLLRNFAVLTLTAVLASGSVFAQGKSGHPAGPNQLITSDRLETTGGPAAEDGDIPIPGEPVPCGDIPIPGCVAGLVTAATYAFAATTATPEDMSTGTTQLVGPSLDDTASAVTAIPFTFRFDGVNYTQFSVNANGLLVLGAVAADAGASGRTNNFATTTNNPKMSAYWDDLCTSPSGKVHYKIVGAPGSRRLVVEWQNVVTFGAASCGTTVLGSVQLWLHEGTGVIQTVSAGMGTNDNLQTGYSLGIGSSSTSFASVTTADSTVSYAASSNGNVAALASGVSYTFSPNVPLAPTGLNATSVTQTSMTINWTDNATNETGYLVERSGDGGSNYTTIATLPANSNTYADSGLFPGSTYFYRVTALTEGSSASIVGSQTTNPAGNVTSTNSGGLWSAPTTWVGGVVPGGGDTVTIVAGATVTIDTAAMALNVNVNAAGARGGKLAGSKEDGAAPEGIASGILRWDATTPSSLTMGGDLTIQNGASFISPEGSTVTTHNLSIGGSLTNNGVLDFSTSSNNAGANITFTGTDNKSFGGSGATTDVRTITVNKTGPNFPTVVANMTNFTVQGATTDSAAAGFLTLTSGAYQIAGTYAGTMRVFPTAAYTIPANAGFWLSNPNFTVAAQTGSVTMNGFLRVSGGTYNVGTAADNSVAFGIGSRVTVEGGTINTSGRFGVAVAATTAINYTQSAGTINACTVGSTSTTAACWDLGTSTAAGVVYSITGGTVVIHTASTAASGPRDYRLQSGATGTGSLNVTGGTVRFGSATTTGVQAFDGAGVFPNVVLDTTSGANTFTMLAPVTWNNLTRNITIGTGGSFSIGSNVFLFNGSSLVNDGVFNASGAAANFVTFDATANATISGSGTWTGVTTGFSLQGLSLTLNQTNNIRVRALRVFVGDLINANKITLGNNDATVSTVQFGNTTTPTLAGTLTGTPVFELGTGGQTVTYLRTGNARVTGPEINPTRTLVGLTYDNNDPATDTLTIAGGDLTVNAAMALTNGEIITGANKLTHNGTVTRTAGLVNGTLNRSYAATGAYTYHVGTGNYSPVAATVTTLTTNPSTLSVTSADGPAAGLDPANAVAHKWTLAETGDLTANLTFTYNNADVVGDENLYVLAKDGVLVPGSTVNAAANTATVTGATDFNGVWGIGKIGAPAAPGDVSGTVRTADGRPIRNIIVVLSGGSLPSPLIVQTGMLGTYGFDDIPPGTYTLTVNSKRFTFTPNSRIVSVNGDIANENFIADQDFGVRNQ